MADLRCMRYLSYESRGGPSTPYAAGVTPPPCPVKQGVVVWQGISILWTHTWNPPSDAYKQVTLSVTGAAAYLGVPWIYTEP